MRVRFACPRCEETVATGDLTLPADVSCPRCGSPTSFARPSGSEGRIQGCPACGGPHLFLQKEFPRRLGLIIATVGAILFLVFMGLEKIVIGFAVLLGVALIDAIIYRLAPLMTVCYHCQTEFRRAPVSADHGAYDPKIAFYTAKKGRPPAREGESAPGSGHDSAGGPPVSQPTTGSPAPQRSTAASEVVSAPGVIGSPEGAGSVPEGEDFHV